MRCENMGWKNDPILDKKVTKVDSLFPVMGWDVGGYTKNRFVLKEQIFFLLEFTHSFCYITRR